MIRSWCWIQNTPTGISLRIVSFFIPLGVILISIFLFYLISMIVLFFSFRKIKNYSAKKVFFMIFLNGNPKELDQVVYESKTYFKLFLYPLVFLFIWILPTINRFLNAFGIQNTIVDIIHLSIVSLYGFFNVLVYFSNPIYHFVVIRNICCFPFSVLIKLFKYLFKKINYKEKNVIVLDDDVIIE
jgi:hypothetical protein